MENSSIKTLIVNKSQFFIQGKKSEAEARFLHSQSAELQTVQTFQLNDSAGSIGILNSMLKRFAKEKPFSLNFTRTDVKGILAFLCEHNGEISIKRKEFENEEDKLVSWAVKYSNKITEPEEVVEHEVESFFDPNAEQERPEKVLKQFLREMR